MKIGIVFTGESYGHGQGVFSGNNRDWRISKENLKTNLIDCFKPEHDVKVYITTYANDLLPELLDFYKPHKNLIVPFEGSHQRTTYIKSMESLLYEDLDFIIATRFDLSFPEPVSSWNIDYDKMNYCFKEIEPHWTEAKFVGDCFFAFPKKYLETFIMTIMEEHSSPYRWHPDMHGIYRHMVPKIGEPNIHFVLDGTHNSNTNSLYKLHRA